MPCLILNPCVSHIQSFSHSIFSRLNDLIILLSSSKRKLTFACDQSGINTVSMSDLPNVSLKESIIKRCNGIVEIFSEEGLDGRGKCN